MMKRRELLRGRSSLDLRDLLVLAEFVGLLGLEPIHVTLNVSTID